MRQDSLLNDFQLHCKAFCSCAACGEVRDSLVCSVPLTAGDVQHSARHHFTGSVIAQGLHQLQLCVHLLAMWGGLPAFAQF